MSYDDFPYGANTPSYAQACMGLLVCPHCGKAVMCGDIEPAKIVVTEEDDNNMIPRNSGQPSQQARGGGRGGKKPNGLPFLSAAEASTMHQPAKIVAARVEVDTFRPGEQVVALKLMFKGQLWLYNIRTNNPSLDVLCEAYGDDENAWSNKGLDVYNEIDDFNGKTWLRLAPAQSDEDEDAPGPATTAARKARGK